MQKNGRQRPYRNLLMQIHPLEQKRIGWRGHFIKKSEKFSRKERSGNPVPIPAAVWLLGSMLIGVIGIRRKLT